MVQVPLHHIAQIVAAWEEPINLHGDGDDDLKPPPLTTATAKIDTDAVVSTRKRSASTSSETALVSPDTSEASRPPKRLAVLSPTAVAVGLLTDNNKKGKGEVRLNVKQIEAPPSEMTGLSQSLTEICANLSQQIYDANSADYFQFPQDSTAKVILFDNHGDMDAVLPAFCIASVENENTLIMAWRGTNQTFDMITDSSFAPVTSPQWGNAALSIRAHGMFSSLVASDLSVHERTITDYVTKNKISRIVFTGHSLGGGLANTAHLFLQANLDSRNFREGTTGRWGDGQLKKNVTIELRTLTFAAPMAIFDIDEVSVSEGVGGRHANYLFQEIAKNTCNILYGCDVVPRCYAHLIYVKKVMDKALPQVVQEQLKLPLGLGSGWVSDKVTQKLQEIVKDMIPVATKYRHVGSLLYYPMTGLSQPLILTDNGPVPSSDKTHLSYYTYESYGIKKDHVNTLLNAHSYFPAHLASHISVDK